MVQLMQLLDLLHREGGVVLGSFSRHCSAYDRVVCGAGFQSRSRGASRLLEVRVDKGCRERSSSMLGVEKCGHLWRQDSQECSILL